MTLRLFSDEKSGPARLASKNPLDQAGSDSKTLPEPDISSP